MQRRVLLPNTLALERKHKGATQPMTWHCNTQSYERAITEELSLNHLHALKKISSEGLLNPRPGTDVSKDYERVVISFPTVRVCDIALDNEYIMDHGNRILSGDVVLLGSAFARNAGCVLMHYKIAGLVDHTAVQLWPLDKATLHAASFRIGESVHLVPTATIRTAVIHKKGSVFCTCILPRGFQWV